MAAKYRGGHAPAYLRTAFDMAVLDRERGTRTPGARLFFFDLETRSLWDRWDTESRLWWASGQLWRSGDLLPDDICAVLDLPAGSSYGAGSRALRRSLVSAGAPA